MKTFEQMQKEYAELIVWFWLNLQKGQNLLIKAPMEAVEFVKLVAKAAYQAWAKEIFYRRGNEELDLIKYQYAPEEVFDTVPQWLEDGYVHELKNNCAQLSLYMQDPEILKEVDPKKVSRLMQAQARSKHEYRKLISENWTNWTIAAIPTVGRANHIYQSGSTEENIQKLRNQIFHLVRVDQEDPLWSWENHIKNLNQYAEYLNSQQFRTLHYQGENTDLMVGLPRGHRWICAGNTTTRDGISFCPNLPTEEVFSAPHKYEVDGIISSTLPLEHNGKMIDKFWLKFEKGKVIDFWAEEGYESLKALLETDEWAKRLWEVAIVPINSPIYESKLIYSNTLFDENASCHFALGSSYPDTIADGEAMNAEQRDQAGMNESLIHVDFMVGNEKLSITGIRENWEEVRFFEHGKWNI